MKIVGLVFSFLLTLVSYSINVDSLINASETNKDSRNRVRGYEQLVHFYVGHKIDSAQYFCGKIKHISDSIKDISIVKKALKCQALIDDKNTNYDSAIKGYLQLEKIYKKEKDSVELSVVYKKIGQVYDNKKESSNAIKYFLKALEVFEKNNKLKDMASIYNSIGGLYFEEDNYIDALQYYKKSLKIANQLNYKYAIGVLNMNIANIYSEIYSRKDEDSLLLSDKDSIRVVVKTALAYYDKSLNIFTELDDLYQMASVYSNMGSLDSNKVIYYLKKSYVIKKRIGDIEGQWNDLYNIAKKNITLGKFEEARGNSQKALNLAKKNNLVRKEAKIWKQLSVIENNLGSYQKAFKSLSNYTYMKDSIETIDIKTKFAEQDKKWNVKQKEKEKEKLKKEKELTEAINEKQRLYLIATVLGLVLLVGLIFFVYRGYKQKQRANTLLSKQKIQIEEANEELNYQNEEISKQRDHIREIHREVSESIEYAMRLQASILPKAKVLEDYLKDYFVLFMPKDKVSGDYYWWTQVDNKMVITAADCTGHGVPGAFMSMLGVSFLKEIVDKSNVSSPNKILDNMRTEIIRTLGQKGVSGEQKDGMDMALITVDKDTNIVQFSGANNPLYIVSKSDLSEQLPTAKTLKLEDDSQETLYELKADKMPIAIYEKMNPFMCQEVQLTKGDRLYMFSDGYADQFGGPKGKKFMYKPFKRLILNTVNEPMRQQQKALRQAFVDWKINEEQIDDVVVIGVEL